MALAPLQPYPSDSNNSAIHPPAPHKQTVIMATNDQQTPASDLNVAWGILLSTINQDHNLGNCCKCFHAKWYKISLQNQPSLRRCEINFYLFPNVRSGVYIRNCLFVCKFGIPVYETRTGLKNQNALKQ